MGAGNDLDYRENCLAPESVIGYGQLTHPIFEGFPRKRLLWVVVVGGLSRFFRPGKTGKESERDEGFG